MKRVIFQSRSSVLVCLTGLIVVLAAIQAVQGQDQPPTATQPPAATQPAPGGGRRGGRGAAAGATPPLSQDMTAMNRALRTLQSQVADPTKNESSLTTIAEMERQVLLAKLSPPRPTPTATDPAKFTTDYKLEIIKLERQCLDLEEALLNNDNQKAATTLAAMAQTETEGHSEFRGRGRN